MTQPTGAGMPTLGPGGVAFPNVIVEEPPVITPLNVAPPPTLDNLADVVGNNAFFNNLNIKGQSTSGLILGSSAGNAKGMLEIYGAREPSTQRIPHYQLSVIYDSFWPYSFLGVTETTDAQTLFGLLPSASTPGTQFYLYDTSDVANTALMTLSSNAALRWTVRGSGFLDDVTMERAGYQFLRAPRSGIFGLTLANNNWQINKAFPPHLSVLDDNFSDIGSIGGTGGGGNMGRPRNIYVGGAIANRTKAGTPTDTDVPGVTDGMLVVDTTASKIWVRIGGAWKGVAVV